MNINFINEGYDFNPYSIVFNIEFREDDEVMRKVIEVLEKEIR